MSLTLGVLRPEPGNAVTAYRIESLGYRALRLPLFAVRPVAWECPDPAGYDSLLLTSANAPRHGGGRLDALKALPVHAVGAATADAARRAGFTVVAVGAGGAEEMRPPGRVLHLTGHDHHAVAGTQTIVVYVSEPLWPDLGALAGGVALVHSPRVGRMLAEGIADKADVAIAAISPVAAEAAGTGWRAVATSDYPTDERLIAAAIGLAD